MSRGNADPVVQELYLCRKMARLNIRNVAHAAGINPATISKAELGFQTPNLAVVQAWANALGFRLELVPIDEEGGNG